MKNRTIYAMLIGTVILSLCFSCNSMKNVGNEDNAIAEAKAWLTLIDEGKYGKSLEIASTDFKKNITNEKWTQMLNAVRKPLGKLVSRKLKTKIFKEVLPGAPDGKYLVIQFITSFENKKSGIETVTTKFNKNSKWKVAGYYIK